MTKTKHELPCDASWADEQTDWSDSEHSQPIGVADHGPLASQSNPSNQESAPRFVQANHGLGGDVSTPGESPPSPVSLAPPVVAAQLSDRHALAEHEVVTVSDLSGGDRSQGPFIAGARLRTPQVTATEHALRLQRENERLADANAALLAETHRLKKAASDTQAFVDRMAAAVSDAKEEMNRLETENTRLKGELTDLESKNKRYQLDTDRMLQTIRDELDDVLMREIATTQN